MRPFQGHEKIDGVIARKVRAALHHSKSNKPIQLQWNGNVRAVTVDCGNLLRVLVKGDDALVMRVKHLNDGWESIVTVHNDGRVVHTESNKAGAEPFELPLDRTTANAVGERIKSCFNEITQLIPFMHTLPTVPIRGLKVVDGDQLKYGPWIFPTPPEAKKGRPDYLKVVA